MTYCILHLLLSPSSCWLPREIKSDFKRWPHQHQTWFLGHKWKPAIKLTRCKIQISDQSQPFTLPKYTPPPSKKNKPIKPIKKILISWWDGHLPLALQPVWIFLPMFCEALRLSTSVVLTTQKKRTEFKYLIGQRMLNQLCQTRTRATLNTYRYCW